MEYPVGAGLALVVCVFSMLVGFDRDRAYYSAMLIVVATYYILFAALANSTPALVAESLAACIFVALAALGFKKNMWVVAAGLAGHGVFDFFHHKMIHNTGVPEWWPGFCLAFDIFAGGFFAMLLMRRTGLASRA